MTEIEDSKREIGSEFQYAARERGRGMSFPREGTLVFSGRTAISAVIECIPSVESVLFPSYCCDSMLEPFRRKGIELIPYDVTYDNGFEISITRDADALLWCNYFGYYNELPDFDGVVIEDITHSLLSNHQCHDRSNYLIASVRKWEPILCGGWCSIKCNGSTPPDDFLTNKSSAMRLKTDYLSDGDEEKKFTYLDMFSESNSWLATNYEGLLIDELSRDYLSCVDIESHRKRRRQNAQVLYDSLRSKVSFLFAEKLMDCPLFVPIIVPQGRDALRKALIGQEIYCPIHWPRPKVPCDSILYDSELSLVCDQRYTPDDMERVAEVIIREIS